MRRRKAATGGSRGTAARPPGALRLTQSSFCKLAALVLVCLAASPARQTAAAVAPEKGVLALDQLIRDSPVPASMEGDKTRFDWRQVRRWGISEPRLPSGSDPLSRQPDAWDQYRLLILATIGALLLQSVLIVGLVAEWVRRRAAERVLRSRELALSSSHEEIRNLAGRILSAQEAERARIASDLHDDVCQEIAGLSVDLACLRIEYGTLGDSNTQRALSSLQRRIVALADSVRSLSHDLHPATLRHIGLASALEAYCMDVERRYDILVRFSADCDLGAVDGERAMCLYRITQEALCNVGKHAEARVASVSLALIGDAFELIVYDDGKGFDLGAAHRGAPGLGLISIQERARHAGGTVTIESEPLRGTSLKVWVPAGQRPAVSPLPAARLRETGDFRHGQPPESLAG